jgi:oligopeptide transport system ATP-binding protein
MRVGDIISEPMLATKLPHEYIRERVTEVLALVGLPPASASLFPHEFSGGQRQRIAVARALSTNPEFVVLDEPVSALDVSIRAQTMNILREIQERLGLTYLIIAHDLAVVRYMSNRIGVMYIGKIVECANSEELYTNPLHPYTKALLASALPTRPGEAGEEVELSGEIASPLNPPPGCRFHPRCTFRMPICTEEEPTLREEANGHQAACHLYRS